MTAHATLEDYREFAGPEAIDALREAARPLRGARVVHVNSTREGGGVAEILHWMVPLMRDLGLDAAWEVIAGEGPFFACTKAFHNGLQGEPVPLDDAMLAAYRETNARNAERLRPILGAAELVVIHDPQPAPLLGLCPDRAGRWVWRCHIDLSHPQDHVWAALRPHVAGYDASVWSMEAFRQPLPHRQVLIAPTIDPLSVKNRPLPDDEVAAVYARFGLDPALPLVTQVSRFDRFKDPLGVIEAHRHARERVPHQLVLAGGGASDDPEGAEVLAEVRAAAGDDPHVHVLLLPPDAHRTINALQRASAVVLQKSLREGFGLTVTEAMWKGVPVIGGDVGGIRLQIEDGETGYLVSTPAQAGERIAALLADPAAAAAMGQRAREKVRRAFLPTRHLADYVALFRALQDG